MALQHLAPASKPAPKPAPVKAVRAEKPTLAVPGRPAVTQPPDRYGFVEGKQYAIETINSMPAMARSVRGRNDLIQTLKRSAAGKPVSQALGIWSVIDVIEEAQQ
ncbi:hypothetical protein CC205_13455 [Pseudomonas savastanoi pv. nerii]|uniref:Uncharacterized protein n=2 Tax=Pseudomonas savastanoi TaxID=29438 RepID=A0A267KED3_PSESS|nr:hypothetical protein CC205_13455 [Pseudomonas savastanoi pv. nerii]RMT72344.1 hypothetical protein ALP42_02549 [Pseudomonas savastanoi pv. nerii]RMT86418.1 hypothetical protein ALP41_00444 [Pseudomonas savastanoi pv. nerii]